MTPTLLLDLDNTLLSNEMDTFLPGYLKALSKHLASFADGSRMIPALLRATEEMTANQRPDCTLKEVFDSRFFPELGVSAPDMEEAIDRFYDQVFPTLRSLTSPYPQAVKLVEEALRRGYRVVVATNPLFPRTAVMQRLEWAGLSADHYPFDLISSCETFHFAKPNPAFLAECLARIGWPEGPIVVVGDSLENDIEPARKLGLASYRIGPEDPGRSLEEFFPWFDRSSPEALEPNYSLPHGLLAILRSTPAVLEYSSRSLAPGAWTYRPGRDEWSLVEIICHLRDVDEEVNLPRLLKVVNETNPFLPGMVTDPWAEERDYLHQNGPAALGRFIAVRMKLLEKLLALPEQGWQRSARHAIFGPTTLQELVSIHASHDRLHVQQALQVLRSYSLLQQ